MKTYYPFLSNLIAIINKTIKGVLNLERVPKLSTTTPCMLNVINKNKIQRNKPFLLLI